MEPFANAFYCCDQKLSFLSSKLKSYLGYMATNKWVEYFIHNGHVTLLNKPNLKTRIDV